MHNTPDYTLETYTDAEITRFESKHTSQLEPTDRELAAWEDDGGALGPQD